jgi:hypothetical protein
VNEPTVISETIDGETVIINLKTGSYYSLKYSGATVWSALQQGGSVAEIAHFVRAKFDTDGQNIDGEIGELVEKLLRENLIRLSLDDASLQADTGLSSESPPSYRTPVLEKFTDMEAMLLLDPVHDVSDQGWPYLPLNDDQLNA